MASPAAASSRVSIVAMPPQYAPVQSTTDALGGSRMALPARTVMTAPAQYVYPATSTGPSYVAGPPQYVTSSAAAGPPQYMTSPATSGSFVASSPQQITYTQAPQMMTAPMTRTIASSMAYAPTGAVSSPVVTMTSGQPTMTYTAQSLSTVGQPMVMAPTVVSSAPRAAAPSPDYVQALEKRLSDLEIAHACKTHSAVVFIKPHAITDGVKQLVRDHLRNNLIQVLSEGEIPAEEIDQQQLIDTHYGAIAAKAVKLKPSELTVQPAAMEKFEQTFGLTWQDALSQGIVFNAMDAAAAMGIAPEDLGAKWATLQKSDLLKFGGGFYCGKVDDIFVINGFYMDMRCKFTTPGTCIYIFETEWDPRNLAWEDFRGKVLGGTNPAEAAEGSLRRLIYENWATLGLSSPPNTGDNGVHASASPFEALSERCNWLNVPIADDFFGRALLASGVSMDMVTSWCGDPTVQFEGEGKSLFDLLEDMDSRDCLRKCAAIAAENM